MSSAYSTLKDFHLKLKNIIFLLSRSLFFSFLQMVIFTTLFQHYLTLLEPPLKMTWQGCFDVVWRCLFQCWIRKLWFDMFQRHKFQPCRTQRCFNVDLNFSDTPRHHINLKMLKWCWKKFEMFAGEKTE